jgi:2-hydroxychromene-2-carboxylate isomerase
LPPPPTAVLAVTLHSYQGKRHKSAAAEEQVYYCVDFRGPPTWLTVTILTILIESIEVAGRIKGCIFSVMLFFATSPPSS